MPSCLTLDGWKKSPTRAPQRAFGDNMEYIPKRSIDIQICKYDFISHKKIWEGYRIKHTGTGLKPLCFSPKTGFCEKRTTLNGWKVS